MPRLPGLDRFAVRLASHPTSRPRTILQFVNRFRAW